MSGELLTGGNVQTSSVFTQKVKPDIYLTYRGYNLKYKPQEDITAYELAQMSAILSVVGIPVEVDFEGMFGDMTDGAKRHWTTSDGVRGDEISNQG